MELICLTCKAESEAFNVKVSRMGYPHKDDCRVQDIRPKATVATITSTTASESLIVEATASVKLDSTEGTFVTNTETKPKKRKASKKKESTE